MRRITFREQNFAHFAPITTAPICDFTVRQNADSMSACGRYLADVEPGLRRVRCCVPAQANIADRRSSKSAGGGLFMTTVRPFNNVVRKEGRELVEVDQSGLYAREWRVRVRRVGRTRNLYLRTEMGD